MDLLEFFTAIATNYDRSAGTNSPTQSLLRTASHELQEHAEGLFVIGSGGKGDATFTPWVGFFDPDETKSPHYGMYVVYLFSEDLRHVTLTLNQGIERLREEFGSKKARQLLRAEAAGIRALLDPSKTKSLNTSMELGSTGDRQRAYEAGNVFSNTYDTTAFPTEEALRSDLTLFLSLYRDAVVARQTASSVTSNRGVTDDESATRALLQEFKPKDASDYVAKIRKKVLVKSRKHELLLQEFAKLVSDSGYQASTPHPVDLEIRNESERWIAEVKIIYKGNATDAVRAVIGQLLTYRHLLYPTDAPPALIAVFNAPIGDAFVELLLSLGISPYWQSDDGWKGPVSSPLDIVDD